MELTANEREKEYLKSKGIYVFNSGFVSVGKTSVIRYPHEQIKAMLDKAGFKEEK